MIYRNEVGGEKVEPDENLGFVKTSGFPGGWCDVAWIIIHSIVNHNLNKDLIKQK